MKTKFFLPVAIIFVVVALVYGYLRMSKEMANDGDADQPITAASRLQSGTQGEAVIALEVKTQQLIGLQTARLSAAMLPPEFKAYGRALDPAPLVALTGEIAASRAALTATGKEQERLQTLASGNNVSAKALEDAEAAMQRDQVALVTAETQLVAGWGQGIAGQPDLPAFVQSLARLETVLVRLEVPAGESVDGLPTGALIQLPGTGPPATARFLGRAALTDVQTQGQGFLFAAKNAPAALTPGLAVTGFLQMPGEPRAGVVVPDAAVVRSDARAWIYLQTSETNFVRREVALDHAVAGGWFVTNAMVAGNQVVITGAQVLLSEERKSEIKLGD